MSRLGRSLMRGIAAEIGKRLDKVGQRVASWLISLLTSHDLQESKARLEEAQRVAHIGYYEWNLIENRVIWSDESYRIFGLTPEEGPIDFDKVREMIHPDDRERVFRGVEEDIRSGVHPEPEHRVVRPNGEVRTVQGLGTVKRDRKSTRLNSSHANIS